MTNTTTHTITRHLSVFISAWRQRKALDHNKQRLHQEREFLPAALELQETPASPIGRTITWIIMLFFVLAVVWATIGKVDIVAVAQGKIIPTDRTKLIQPLEIGVIKQIHVHEGQQVAEGDLLLELDSTSTEADQEQLLNELHTARLARLRVNTLLKAIDQKSNRTPLQLPTDDQGKEVHIQSQLLSQQYNEYRARLGAFNSERQKRQAEIAAINESVKKLQATLPLITRRVESLRKLSQDSMVAEHTVLELEEQRITQQQDLAINQNQLIEAQAAIDEVDQQTQAYHAEFRTTILAELTETERRLKSIEQEHIKAKQRTGQQRLTAPIAGTVQQLAVHTVGGVVTPAQELMRIVPQEGVLEVEAWLQNKDIGFVEEGMSAEVKVDAFPFTKYGLIDAELMTISNDAIADENLGLVYAARVLLKSATMQVDNKVVNLSPGMSVTVEMKTGQRRLIEFFLSPLLRYKQESVRER